MIRRFGAFLTALVLLLCCSVVFACNVRSEALPASEEEDYGLIQSENIIITVFTEENMKTYEIPENDALQFSRTLKAGWNLGNTFDAQDEGKASQAATMKHTGAAQKHQKN